MAGESFGAGGIVSVPAATHEVSELALTFGVADAVLPRRALFAFWPAHATMRKTVLSGNLHFAVERHAACYPKKEHDQEPRRSIDAPTNPTCPMHPRYRNGTWASAHPR